MGKHTLEYFLWNDDGSFGTVKRKSEREICSFLLICLFGFELYDSIKQKISYISLKNPLGFPFFFGKFL